MNVRTFSRQFQTGLAVDNIIQEGEGPRTRKTPCHGREVHLFPKRLGGTREGGRAEESTVGDSLNEPHGCPPAHPPAQVHDRHDCLLPRGLKCHRNAELAC